MDTKGAKTYPSPTLIDGLGLTEPLSNASYTLEQKQAKGIISLDMKYDMAALPNAVQQCSAYTYYKNSCTSNALNWNENHQGIYPNQIGLNDTESMYAIDPKSVTKPVALNGDIAICGLAWTPNSKVSITSPMNYKEEAKYEFGYHTEFVTENSLGNGGVKPAFSW